MSREVSDYKSRFKLYTHCHSYLVGMIMFMQNCTKILTTFFWTDQKIVSLFQSRCQCLLAELVLYRVHVLGYLVHRM